MTHSSAPGNKPLVSNRLNDYFASEEEEPTYIIEDEFDALILRENLKISRFVWIRELDLALLVLNNRRVITQTLTAYPVLVMASDDDLSNYTVTESGIHWPALDADLSLRGLLMSEVMKGIAA